MLNSSGFCTYRLTISISKASVMFSVSSTSSSKGGKGTIIMPTTDTMPIASKMSLERKSAARPLFETVETFDAIDLVYPPRVRIRRDDRAFAVAITN
ncbi:hypothetical protein D3C78_1726900 [compost metagenome]